VTFNIIIYSMLYYRRRMRYCVTTTLVVAVTYWIINIVRPVRTVMTYVLSLKQTTNVTFTRGHWHRPLFATDCMTSQKSLIFWETRTSAVTMADTICQSPRTCWTAWLLPTSVAV